MQFLIKQINERITNVGKNSKPNENVEILTTLKVIRADCMLLLGQEKSQIEDAFNYAEDQVLFTQEETYDGSKTFFHSANDYYVKTYENLDEV
jgi:hypothetical protein